MFTYVFAKRKMLMLRHITLRYVTWGWKIGTSIKVWVISAVTIPSCQQTFCSAVCWCLETAGGQTLALPCQTYHDSLR